MVNQISQTDVTDSEFLSVEELGSDGTFVYLTTTVVSTTSGTKIVVINLPSDGEGILLGRDHPAQSGDFVVITGTSGGLGDGTFTIDAVLTDTSFSVLETIGTSTGGSVDFIYPPGAKSIGYDQTLQNTSSGVQLEQVVTDVSNATLLDDEPGSVAATTYTVTKTGSTVTREKWVNAGNSRTIKQIDYTYSGVRVTTEIRKVFSASDGTTIIAQKTLTYSYSGSNVIGATITRDI